MGVAKLTDQNTIVPESKYARVERERRYLLADLPDGLTRVDPHLQLTDNYITGTRLPNPYLNALEAEVLSVFNTNEIRKNRYRFEFEGRQFGVDMFLGDLFGLVLAEVSFETDEELDDFRQPPFAIAEVTNDPVFSGGSLAELTFAEVKKHMLETGLITQQR